MSSLLCYTTCKYVIIGDRRLGVFYYVLAMLILFYMIFEIILNKGYLEIDNKPQGVIRIIISDDLPSLNTSSLPYCHFDSISCRYETPQELNWPIESQAITITTFVRDKFVQATDDPLQNDVVKEDRYFTIAPENVIIKVDHAIIASHLSKQGYGSIAASTRQMKGYLLYTNGTYFRELSVPGKPDRLSLKEILAAGNIDTLDQPSTAISAKGKSIRERGLILKVTIHYQNWFFTWFGTSDIEYSFQVRHIPFLDYSSKQILRSKSEINASARSILKKRYSIRMEFEQSGSLGTFSFSALLLKLVSGIGLLTLTATIIDAVALYLLPNKDYYRRCVFEYEKTNFDSASDVRKKNTLDTFLDFLICDSDNENKQRPQDKPSVETSSIVDTPHIDEVLHKYHNNMTALVTKSSTVNSASECDQYRSQHGERENGELKSDLTSLSEAASSGDLDTPISISNKGKELRSKGQKPTTNRPSADNMNNQQTIESTPMNHSQNRDKEERRLHRWKAEQAAVKLAELVRRLQTEVEETHKKFELSVCQKCHLETALIKEKEKMAKMDDEIRRLKCLHSDEQNETMKLQKRYDNQLLQLNNLQEQLEKANNSQTEVFREMNDRMRESEKKFANSQHELSFQQQLVRKLQLQIQELQALIAAREKERIKELEYIDRKNVDGIVEKEVAKERLRLEQVVMQYKEKLNQQHESYQYLEDEFRSALHIEATRYSQLEGTYQKLTEELVTCRENLNISKDRDAKATKLINDLSTILREQKAQNAHLKEKVQNISGQCDENSKLLSNEITLKAEAEKRLLLLSEENLAMKSKLSAQDSLLNGLREERNLWSKELATQGASLASDRGRMESQIEFLSTQVLELQGFQKNCKTTLKIKDKVIEDQVLTIKELKQEVNQLKSELSVSQSEWADKLKILQQKLDDELLENQNVTQQVEMMKGQETYYQIQLQDYCDNERKFKDKYSVLKKQWEERVGLLVQLEENFKKLQETSKRREKDLIIECDRAKNETKQTVQKFQLLQIKFKEQSASFHETIDEKVQIALKDKQKELDTANLKISQVEEDMRNLLSETCKERKTMEAKLDRLSRAFQDVQKELH